MNDLFDEFLGYDFAMGADVIKCHHCGKDVSCSLFFDNDEIVSFAKNYYEVHFKIDYKNVDGTIANYYPNFFVKTDDKTVYIIETKGREDLDDPLKIARLAQWCDDANARQKKIMYEMLYVKQEEWDKYKPKSWDDLVKLFSLAEVSKNKTYS